MVQFSEQIKKKTRNWAVFQRC